MLGNNRLARLGEASDEAMPAMRPRVWLDPALFRPATILLQEMFANSPECMEGEAQTLKTALAF